uniref:Uncharacterized protein n=1 Tax=Candidozyma auris TaxID=498019 RepID=A0A0L0P810_CANAR
MLSIDMSGLHDLWQCIQAKKEKNRYIVPMIEKIKNSSNKNVSVL